MAKRDDENGGSDYREKSFNRAPAARAVIAANYEPVPKTEISLGKLKHRIDDYFESVEWPTISGLALIIGFNSIDEYSEALESQKTWCTANPDDKVAGKTLRTLTKARSRIILHYEEAMQAGTIPPQAGKFLLETLGIQPPVQRTQAEAGSRLAADAAKQGAAKQLEAARKAGQVAKKALG